jgi:hypothetical protein
MTVQDAASFPDFFILASGDDSCGCYHFNFADKPSPSHGPLFTLPQAVAMPNCTGYPCCGCCKSRKTPYAYLATMNNVGSLVGTCVPMSSSGPGSGLGRRMKIISVADFTSPRVILNDNSVLSGYDINPGVTISSSQCFWRTIVASAITFDLYIGTLCTGTPDNRFTADLQLMAYWGAGCTNFTMGLETSRVVDSAGVTSKVFLWSVGKLGHFVGGFFQALSCGGTTVLSDFLPNVGEVTGDCEEAPPP